MEVKKEFPTFVDTEVSKTICKSKTSLNISHSGFKNKADILNIPNSEIVLSCDSPRYVRKKRYAKHQIRRTNSYHIPKDSQLSNVAQKKSIVGLGNECEKAKHKSYKTMKPNDFLTSFPQYLTEEFCHLSSDTNESSSVSDEPVCKPSFVKCKRKRSCSYPGGHKNHCLVTSNSCKCILKSCDTLETSTLSDVQLNANEHTSNMQSSCSNSSNTVDCMSIDSSSVSRRSSTSTIRVRNNSVDSAISQMSIIDISEIDDMCVNENSTVSESNSSAWKPQHSRSKSDASCGSNQPEMDDFSDISISSSLPSSLSKNTDSRKKSIFEGRQMDVPTECFFPRPQQGQSLTSFLSSNEFNTRAELDRENAHFFIAEAMISAIERIKCAKTAKVIEEEEEEESDEEIRKLTQRIRIRRRERQREKSVTTLVLLSDGKTDTTTSQSTSPPISSHSSDYEVDSIGSEDEDEIEDIELTDHTGSNLSSMKENGLSLSMASLYSDADLQKIPCSYKGNLNKRGQDIEVGNVSAESVALSLLRRFSEKQLPKASDLEWLVSEQDAPQRLLPLPDSWPISPDTVEEEYSLEKIRLRGNLEWAPPRPQIIFIIHAQLKRKVIIEKQKYQCAGCGMKIEQSYISRFRYCDYFGKYFCQCCHSNSLACIPGRILWKWDFTKYYVSKLAWNLLDQMFGDPLFSVIDINGDLYRKVRQLELCRMYRIQLFYLKDFIRTCRKAEQIQLELEQQSHHIAFEPHIYSISDLLQVKNGELSRQLYRIVNHCTDHVKHCILCQAKGFICEVCDNASDIIFPFQLDKVLHCEKCGSCFHKRCFKTGVCPKCLRIEARKKRLQEERNRQSSDEDA